MASGYNKSMCGNHDDLYCNHTWNGAHCGSTDWTPIPQNETEIAVALYDIGPLSVLMNAAHLQTYKGGVYEPKYCDPADLDHGVLLVGYGTDSGTDYWIVKNSW